MNRHTVPMHMRYCGTKTPDKFLLETAYEFVSQCLSKHLDVDWKQRVVRLPSKGGNPSHIRPGASELWINLFSAYEGDECIIYPFSTAASPRGMVTFNFKRMPAHRAMCLKVNKLPEDPKAMALHRCGNGHLGCVTPKHLYWGDASDNAKDAQRHRREGKPSAQRSNPLRVAKF